jgi:hypothetical protein
MQLKQPRAKNLSRPVRAREHSAGEKANSKKKEKKKKKRKRVKKKKKKKKEKQKKRQVKALVGEVKRADGRRRRIDGRGGLFAVPRKISSTVRARRGSSAFADGAKRRRACCQDGRVVGEGYELV